MAPAVKSDMDDIQHAGSRKEAEAAVAVFSEKYDAKYPKGIACLTKDKDAMLTFFDFPAEHWGHLRTSNPPLGDCWQSPAGQRIESVFSSVRHQTVRTKRALSQKTTKLMVFTLIQAASKKWLRLNGRNQLPKVIEGIKFSDGVEVTSDTESPAAC
jgi:putative transposase